MSIFYQIELIKDYYDITFDNFSIAMFHLVTTEFEKISEYARNFCQSLIESDDNFILVYPNMILVHCKNKRIRKF